MVYGLLVLDLGAERADQMFHLIALVVVLSILAHSSSDVPIAQYFARRRTTLLSGDVSLSTNEPAGPPSSSLPAGP